MVNDDLPTQIHEEPYLPETPETQAPEPPVAEEAGVPPVAEEEQLPASDTARLVVKRGGAETDTEFTIHPPVVIGRYDVNAGPIDIDLGGLPESAYISRKHAKIDHENGMWTIHDLGSSNGTFVLRDDFERVEEAELTDGQEFALGNARFVFHLT